MSHPTSNEAADLSAERYDADTAAFVDRDAAGLLSHRIRVPAGRAVAGTEAKVFAWTKFQYVTDETDEREGRKEDLHGGQLHRENRAAERVLNGLPPVEEKGGRKGRGGAGGGGGFGGKEQGMGYAKKDGKGVIQVAKKESEGALPLAKGVPREVSREEAKEWFWEGPLV